MAKWYHGGHLALDILDEILFRNPPDATRHTETSNGVTRMVEEITFADGSRLRITAQVDMPPMADMTPRQTSYIKGNGEKGKRMDGGAYEAQQLARQSMAIRMMETFSKILRKIPEIKKVECPVCCGEHVCNGCHGAGCEECNQTGKCPECFGRGVLAI